MKRWFLLLCVLLTAMRANAQTVVLANGSVIDGTGKPRTVANVRIRDGKISDMGVFKPAAGEMVLDVKGLIIAPGFIDFDTLNPSKIQTDPTAASLLLQGVTTAIIGADGTGVYSVEDFMLPFDEKPPAVNIAMLVGHATVRKQILGPDYKRAATGEELAKMTALVTDAMKQGAFGLGTNLQEEPASFSNPAELITLAKATLTVGGTVVMNLRNEGDKVSDAVKESIALARDLKVPVQVRTTNKAALAEIEKARTQKVDISADIYSFSQLARDKTVNLERAIQRMTSTAAARMGLRERGVLKKLAPADIVVFNPAALASGMKFVFVNGMMTVKDGQPTEARAGHALR